ncbi:MAG: response regulator [Anaerolineae bacterium]
MVVVDPAVSPLVLVADDEQMTTVMLQHILERAGYRVTTVHDGQAALEAAQEIAPDILLLDILMPVLNGFEVLQRLREQPETANLPTILITANAREPADVARGLRLGADDYIQKPFAPPELLARIESKLRSSRLERALQQRTSELEQLLRVSQTLNAHLTEVELLEVILELVQQIIAGSKIAVFRLTEEGLVRDYRDNGVPKQALERLAGAKAVSDVIPFHADITLNWSEQDHTPLPGIRTGMLAPMVYRDSPVGFLLVVGQNEPYRAEQQRLLEGVAQQAALALVNAQLYDILADYAQNLESMVEARTNELQSAQQLLIRSEKLSSIGRLAASIAHEINNPLMPIRNLLETIVEDLDAQNVEYDHQAVTIIQDSLERIRGIVSRMLEFSRDQKPGMEWLDVSRVLETVIALNRKSFEHDRMRIDTEVEHMPTIFGSPDQLQQVFMNIVLNAHAAMSAGGRLVIRTRALEGWILVEFEDNGVGVAPEHFDQIFEPFFSTKPTGTGLGLFVSHNIVQAHQGVIEVRNNETGGATFTVRLPRTNEPPRA